MMTVRDWRALLTQHAVDQRERHLIAQWQNEHVYE